MNLKYTTYTKPGLQFDMEQMVQEHKKVLENLTAQSGRPFLSMGLVYFESNGAVALNILEMPLPTLEGQIEALRRFMRDNHDPGSVLGVIHSSSAIAIPTKPGEPSGEGSMVRYEQRGGDMREVFGLLVQRDGGGALEWTPVNEEKSGAVYFSELPRLEIRTEEVPA